MKNLEEIMQKSPLILLNERFSMNKLSIVLLLGFLSSLNVFSAEEISLGITCVEGALSSNGQVIESNLKEGKRVIIAETFAFGLFQNKSLAVFGEGGRLKSDPYKISDIFEIETIENSSSKGGIYENVSRKFTLITHSYTGTVEPVEATVVFDGKKLNLVCHYPDDFHSSGYGDTVKAIESFLDL